MISSTYCCHWHHLLFWKMLTKYYQFFCVMEEPWHKNMYLKERERNRVASDQVVLPVWHTNWWTSDKCRSQPSRGTVSACPVYRMKLLLPPIYFMYLINQYLLNFLRHFAKYWFFPPQNALCFIMLINIHVRKGVLEFTCPALWQGVEDQDISGFLTIASFF